MFFNGIGTAAPSRSYAQTETWTAFQAAPGFGQLAPRSQALLRKVLTGDNGIRTRHLALDELAEAFVLTPDVLHARFARHAPDLATTAARRALADAGMQPGEIDALLVSTCTGYLCPGLTSYVSEQLGLRPDIHALDLVGQGCGAAIPNLGTAAKLLASGLHERVLCVCVEVCSAAFYLDDDPGVLISACLFGDGAGAAVVTRAPMPGHRRIEWRTSASLLSPADRDYLRFEQRGGMLRNILTRPVPALAAKHAETILRETLARAEVPREAIQAWMVHAAGRDVLRAIQGRLGLAGPELRWSEGVLREHGNVSSASLFFVLQAALAGGAAPGHWWLTSFGAGFSCHGALLAVEGVGWNSAGVDQQQLDESFPRVAQASGLPPVGVPPTGCGDRNLSS